MTELTIDRTPFSAFGSGMGISFLKGVRAPVSPGYYLRAYHRGTHAVMRLVFDRDGVTVPVSAQQSVSLLTFADADGGAVDFCFDGPDTLRVRGRGGLGLRLEQVVGWTVAYAVGDNLVTLNISTLRRYQVESLSGRMEAQGLLKWRKRGSEQVSVALLPGDDGCWAAAIDEYWSTWQPRSRSGFDTVLAASQAAFETWLEGMPRAPANLAHARRIAAYIDWSCVVNPGGFLRRPTMLMSKNWMTNVWSWDHCFNAMALATGHGDLAWDQMLLMADHQDAFGAYPDAYNDEYMTFNYSKPPVHGWATLEIWRRNPTAATEERLATIYDSLKRWTGWWLQHRRLPGQVLPYYPHGNDSGWDNSTMFDEGVPLVSPDLTAFLIVQLDALSELAQHLGLASEAAGWTSQADRLQAALIDELWQGDHFAAKLGCEGRVVESQSLIPNMPILLGERLPETMRAQLAGNIEAFVTARGPATELPASPKYTPDGYWRGPIWAPSTYIIVCGLERSGYQDLAHLIARRFCDMCDASGFAENYDALSGEALRDPAYTWTASVFLLLAERLVGE